MKNFVAYHLVLCSILMVLSENSFASLSDSIIKLNTVAITETRIKHNFDESIFNQKNLAGRKLSDFLTEQTPLYLKNYGSGQLATISFRGTSASQTDLLWNGIRLNSPMLGQNDLSLFTNGMQDNIAISSYGAIGAQLELKNKAELDSATHIIGDVVFRVASFKTTDFLISTKYKASWFTGSTRFSVNNSVNDFTFRNTFKELAPIEKQQHAELQQIAFFQELTFKVPKHNEFSAFFWYTTSSRNLPPIISQTKSLQTQSDEAFRAMLFWDGSHKKLSYKITTAYLDELIWYKDPLANLDSKSKAIAVRNKMGIVYSLPKDFYIGGNIYYDYERAKAGGYTSIKHRTIYGAEVFLEYFTNGKLFAKLNFKQEVNANRASAFAPSLLLKYFLVKKHHSFNPVLIIERAFRFPTLNDLYWKEGGNLNLQPEKAWKGEVKLNYRYSAYLNLTVSNFYNLVDNWILWHPQSNGIWSPDNVKNVFSRGLETTLQLSNDLENRKKFGVHLSAIYSYTKTTNINAINNNDASKDKQLIYVPLHKLNVITQLSYKGFYVRSANLFTDKVYTATDNSEFLKGYFIYNLEFGKDFYFHAQQIGITFKVNNINDSAYQVVAQRAMPGRSFEGTIKLNFRN